MTYVNLLKSFLNASTVDNVIHACYTLHCTSVLSNITINRTLFSNVRLLEWDEMEAVRLVVDMATRWQQGCLFQILVSQFVVPQDKDGMTQRGF